MEEKLFFSLITGPAAVFFQLLTNLLSSNCETYFLKIIFMKPNSLFFIFLYLFLWQVSIFIFLSPDMRKQTFNQLLAVLAIYDILWVEQFTPWINWPKYGMVGVYVLLFLSTHKIIVYKSWYSTRRMIILQIYIHIKIYIVIWVPSTYHAYINVLLFICTNKPTKLFNQLVKRNWPYCLCSTFLWTPERL